ncbi:MAG: hypothetical protein WBH03_17715 [Cyclobacteriaceae bacterium]
MIRDIEYRQKLEGKEAEKCLIIRRFVPIEIAISENGQYKTFKEKIPHNIRKVVGVVITHDAPDHKMHHNRVYVGNAPNGYINQELICRLNNDLIGSQAVTYQIEVKQADKLYYAQPKRLPIPELMLNGNYGDFKEPILMELRDFWTDFKEDYLVWESWSAGLGKVELKVSPSTENISDGGLNDDDDDY